MTMTMRLAVIGTGRMGGAMVGRLRRAGFEVTVYNRSRDKAEAVAAGAGATVAATAREAAASADVVLVSLADDSAVSAAYGGGDGIAAGLRPGSVVLETSTIAPETVAVLHTLVDKQAATLLDTPVSGSVSFVEEGRLTVLAGGSREALEQVRPVLDTLAERVFHVGAGGTGAAMKLAVNSVVHGLNQALSEALVLAERAGIPRESAYEVFAASAVAAPFVRYKRDAYLHPDETPVAFTLELVAKDLDLILDLAERVGASMHQARLNRRLVHTAAEGGFGGRDLSAMAEFLRSGGPEVPEPC
ncbi:3-hydroxyisobutyrate dehydrogenase [Streptomyces albiflavescens]|uniref:3-hydroxyisobutyrate dehydrogenase n=1 Tax=Streptomyces albiflavescens TaxID=1623582 RepID=A0A917XYN4_9ACTN|nr:NAD(P)-dependent oxidoreductase [Streptomyces albiflavescens]GGN58963.1 3-hydroxyisobutyrate dehydrogenase [Streptomyces albiflavescens]